MGIILTVDQLNEINKAFFITHLVDGKWQKEWTILTDFMGNIVTDFELAKEVVRKKFKWGVGIADFEQASLGNAMWDNL